MGASQGVALQIEQVAKGRPLRLMRINGRSGEFWDLLVKVEVVFLICLVVLWWRSNYIVYRIVDCGIRSMKRKI